MRVTEINVSIKITHQLEPENLKEWFSLWFIESPLMFETLEDITVTLSNGEVFTIPKGLKMDGSSSPRILWSFYPPIGAFIKAAVFHDYIYRKDIRRKEMGDYNNRKWADNEMLFLSNVYNPTYKADNWKRYKAVRLFGKKIFERTKKK